MCTERGWANHFGQRWDPNVDRNRFGQTISVNVGIPTLTEMVGPTPFGTRLDPNVHRNGWSDTISVNVGIQTVVDVVRCAVGRISLGHFRCHDSVAMIRGDARR